MTSTDALAGSLVEELVHQFTDPFAFYRELIQNSIDAGSSRIEVTLAFRPGADGGLGLITVADWGEGMNRDIIENYLVTKFRSTKENDLTKIGKFGIGFVSIFSCRPDAVTVETGRDGESWRVLFRADTTWELLKLAEPVEGTRITLHKALQPSEWTDFVARSREAIVRWVRHSDVDVVFAAGPSSGEAPPPHEPVREPLLVDAPFQVEHVEDGTHIVAGPARARPAPTGLYNRGLTLLETTEPLVPGVALKIVSRYLEHTLTRDNVRRDRHFTKAIDLARALADGKLLEQLPSELAAAAERRDGFDDWATLFRFALPRLKPAQLSYRLTGGGARSRAAVLEGLGKGPLPVALERSPVVDRLVAAKVPVLELQPGVELTDLVLRSLRLERVVLADEHYTYAATPEKQPWQAFTAALLDFLVRCGARLEQVEVSPVRGAGRAEAVVLLHSLGRPLPFAEALGSPFERGAPKVLCLNPDHEAIAAALALFSSAPRLAALLLARLVLVRHGRLDASTDESLTEWGLT